jgi:hypothetical protein
MKGKLILMFVIASYFAICCDKEMYYTFIVENKSKDEIIVSFKPIDESDKTLTIAKEAMATIYNYTITEGTKIYEREIGSIFANIKVESNSVPSKINYLSNDTWYYNKKSNTRAVYYLEVDSTHFEQK